MCTLNDLKKAMTTLYKQYQIELGNLDTKKAEYSVLSDIFLIKTEIEKLEGRIMVLSATSIVIACTAVAFPIMLLVALLPALPIIKLVANHKARFDKKDLKKAKNTDWDSLGEALALSKQDQDKTYERLIVILDSVTDLEENVDMKLDTIRTMEDENTVSSITSIIERIDLIELARAEANEEAASHSHIRTIGKRPKEQRKSILI